MNTHGCAMRLRLSSVKGKSSFQESECAELRRLLAEKQIADRDRQKALRGRMRSIGFYITDWTGDQQGFTVLTSTISFLEEPSPVSHMPTLGSNELLMVPSRPICPSGPAYQEQLEARRRREVRRSDTGLTRSIFSSSRRHPRAHSVAISTSQKVVEQDSLCRYVCHALLGREPTRAQKEELLEELRDRDVFLIDLQQEPRDGTPLSEFVPALVERCLRMQPKRIVLVKATVFDAAYRPLKQAGLPVSSVRVPFPGSGQQKRFLVAFQQALDE